MKRFKKHFNEYQRFPNIIEDNRDFITESKQQKEPNTNSILYIFQQQDENNEYLLIDDKRNIYTYTEFKRKYPKLELESNQYGMGLRLFDSNKTQTIIIPDNGEFLYDQKILYKEYQQLFRKNLKKR